MKNLLSDHRSINRLIRSSKKEKWSNRLYTRKDLDALYEVDPKINKKDLKIIIKALYYKKYKPYFLINKKKVEIKIWIKMLLQAQA